MYILFMDQVAEYLGKEFYARNYNIRQRIDILEVGF